MKNLYLIINLCITLILPGCIYTHSVPEVTSGYTVLRVDSIHYNKSEEDVYMSFCSAVLVDKNVAISAAHCFHQPPFSLEFAIAKVDQNFEDSMEIFAVSAIFIEDCYLTDSENCDFAVLILNTTSTNIVPIKPVLTLKSDEGQTIYASGYPGSYRTRLTHTSGNILSISDKTIEHSGILYPGMSGGALILNGQLIGVNVLVKHNSAIASRLTEERLQVIKYAIELGGYSGW